jgi:hypothetical protein
VLKNVRDFPNKISTKTPVSEKKGVYGVGEEQISKVKMSKKQKTAATSKAYRSTSSPKGPQAHNPKGTPQDQDTSPDPISARVPLGTEIH